MAGSVTFDLDRLNVNALVLNVTWTGEASGGTVTGTAIPAHIVKTIKGLSVVLAVVNPGTTAPTDGYSITLTDSDSIDVFGGVMNTLSSTTSEQFVPNIVGGGVKRVTDGSLTFNVADTAVNSATGVCRIYFTN